MRPGLGPALPTSIAPGGDLPIPGGGLPLPGIGLPPCALNSPMRPGRGPALPTSIAPGGGPPIPGGGPPIPGGGPPIEPCAAATAWRLSSASKALFAVASAAEACAASAAASIFVASPVRPSRLLRTFCDPGGGRLLGIPLLGGFRCLANQAAFASASDMRSVVTLPDGKRKRLVNGSGVGRELSAMHGSSKLAAKLIGPNAVVRAAR